MLRTRILGSVSGLFLLMGSPAFAGVGLINGGVLNGAVADGTVNGSTTITTPGTTVAIPSGSLVVQGASQRSNQSFTCSDNSGVGNTWHPLTTGNGSGQAITSCWTIAHGNMAIGTTFTVVSAVSAAKGLIVGAWSGLAASPADAATPATGSIGTSAAPLTSTSGTPTCVGGGSNCILEIGIYSISVTASPSPESSGFSTLGTLGATTQGSLNFAERITNSTTPVAYGPTNATSGAWAAQLLIFDAASSAIRRIMLIQSIP